MNNFNIKGTWWLASNPELQLVGELSFNQETGGYLNLHSGFISIDDHYRDNDFELDIIHGLSIKGDLITLMNCSLELSSKNSLGIIESKYFTSMILVGNKYFNQESISTRVFSFKLNNTDEWFNQTGFSVEDFFTENTYEGLSVSYHHPKEITTQLLNKRLITTYRISHDSERNSHTLKSSTYLKVESENNMSIEEIQNFIYSLTTFFSFSTGQLSSPLYIHLHYPNPEFSLDDNKVCIFYWLSYYNEDNSMLWPNMRFSYRDIETSYETVLSNWIEKFQQLRPIINLYFHPLYQQNISREQELLSYVQALETYHSYVDHTKPYEETSYSNFINSIISKIPEDSNQEYQEKVIDSLKHSNNFSLRQRLKALYKDNQYIMDRLVKNKKRFIHDVNNTRNYYTHYRRSLKNDVLSGKDLLKTNMQLKLLIDVIIMKELGFESNFISTALAKDKYYRYLINKM